MAKRTQTFLKNKLLAHGTMYSYTLPRAPISKVIMSGVIATQCATEVTANELIEWIRLRINGKEFIEIGGDSEDGKIPRGIQCWREFHKQKHNGVAMATENWVIELPDALPVDAQVDLIFKVKTQAMTTCTDSALVYNLDIVFELDDKVKGKVVVPFIMGDKFDIGAGSGHQYHYIPALPYKLRAVIMVVEESGTISSSAEDDINDITVKTPLKVIFDGTMTQLKAWHEAKSGVALTEGYFIVSFKGGIKVAPNTLLFDFFLDAADTDIEVHFLYICY